MKPIARYFFGGSPVAAILLLAVWSLSSSKMFAEDSAVAAPKPPPPLVPGGKVMTLWPAGSPMLKGLDQEEVLTHPGKNPEYIQCVTNIHNPSIEVHLAPADKANGTAIVVAPGGGNRELWVGPEGVEVANWLNTLGTSAFVLRYRLQPYHSAVEALADTQRSIRLVRAHAKEWGIGEGKVGVMGFSAGGEQAARVALHFDGGDASATDPVEKMSDRPDFVALVYAGWGKMDLSEVPKDAPPAFLMSAGVDDAFHARETVEFYNAYFNAKIPAELHIYHHGGHGGSIKPRNGIPMGTWQYRFVDWANDLGFMKKP